MLHALKTHWPEYLMEAGGLGIFMVSACTFTVLLEHPASWVNQAIESPALRHFLMGLAMGLTAIGIIYSPWGKRSGAHMNPGVTLTFFRLGKIERWDTFFYVVFQFAGGVLGVVVSRLLIGMPLGHTATNYAVTVPGPQGPAIAFWAEFLISFLLMAVILVSANTSSLARYTGVFAGILLAIYITAEAPLSGMSINPARTLGSAWPAGVWTAIWIYFIAPPLAMLLAGEWYWRGRGLHAVFCAKLHHHNDKRCIFRCNFEAMRQGGN